MNSEELQFHKEAFDKIPEEKRKRVLDAATTEFAQYGFENTSIQQIAKKAEITPIKLSLALIRSPKMVKIPFGLPTRSCL